MDEEPEHMNREQGEGWADGLVDLRLRAASAGTDPSRPGASCLLHLSSDASSDPASFP